MYICLCKGISASQVQELGRTGVCTAEELAQALGIADDDVCGRCLRNIERLLALATDALTGETGAPCVRPA